jgi:hypothetical protein
VWHRLPVGVSLVKFREAIQPAMPNPDQVRQRLGAGVFPGDRTMTKQMHHSPIHDPGDFIKENFETLRDIAVDMAEANKRFCALQLESIHAAFAEHSRQLKSMLDNTGDISAAYDEGSKHLFAKMQKLTEISHSWLDLYSRTSSKTNELLQQSLSTAGSFGEQMIRREAGLPEGAIERRISASVISFPERRAAEIAKKSGIGIEQMEGKRNTA